MADIAISETARIDLQDILTVGIEKFGETVAENHPLDIRQRFERLSRYPMAGSARPEFRYPIRSPSRNPPSHIVYRLG